MSMLRALAAGLICAGAVTSADFEFADFSSTKRLTLISNAHRAKKALRLTSADRFQVGAAWFDEKQPVTGGFDTTFSFRLTDQNINTGGADGFAFVVQNEGPKVRGGLGASGGFMRSDNGAPGEFQRGIIHRLAVFFDTFENDWDATGNAVVVCTAGDKPDLRWPPRCLAYSEKLRVRLKNGKPHTARIRYQPPRLAVYVDDMDEPLYSVSVDLARLVGGDGTAWVGFTSSTGGSFENHDILKWNFAAAPRTDASSNMMTVASSISFLPAPCLPDRKLCTLSEPVVQEKGPGWFHIYLPANREWGVSVPNPSALQAVVSNVTGIVCWDPRLGETLGCNGPAGNGIVPGTEAEGDAGFVSPRKPAGSLVGRTLNGRVWFSINDRMGDAFKDNEGYFEFDLTLNK
jgi:hypothetical protein